MSINIEMSLIMNNNDTDALLDKIYYLEEKYKNIQLILEKLNDLDNVSIKFYENILKKIIISLDELEKQYKSKTNLE